MGVLERAYPRISKEYIMVVDHRSPDLRDRTCILESDRRYPDRPRQTSCHVQYPRYTQLYLNLSVSCQLE